MRVGLVEVGEDLVECVLGVHDRPARAFAQVEVAAPVGGVGVEVGGEVDEGPVEEGVVEHDGRVVGDQDVGEGEQFADVVVAGDVVDGAGRGGGQGGALHVVAAHQQDVGGAELLGEPADVQRQFGVLVAGPAAEGRRVEDHRAVVRNAEGFGERRAGRVLFAGGDEAVVARVAGGQQLVRVEAVGAAEGVGVVRGADQEVVEAVDGPLGRRRCGSFCVLTRASSNPIRL